MPQRSRVPVLRILLDVHMPGRSGIDVLKELNAWYRAPIFIISGKGGHSDGGGRDQERRLDFIEKPFDAGSVVSRVRSAIEASGRRKSAARDPRLLRCSRARTADAARA